MDARGDWTSMTLDSKGRSTTKVMFLNASISTTSDDNYVNINLCYLNKLNSLQEITLTNRIVTQIL